MPIYKYKTIQEADMTLCIYELNNDYIQSLRELFDFAYRINPAKNERGIFKFKTIEEANRHRQKSEIKSALNKY